MPPYTNPSVTDFKNQFTRDFPYGGTGGDLTKVQDSDVTNAINLAALQINAYLFPSQSYYTMGFLFLAAHYLVVSLRNSSQGLSGSYSWLQSSKSVGGASQGFAIPQRILDNPVLSQFAQTNYGAQYLNLTLPLITGQTFSVSGWPNP